MDIKRVQLTAAIIAASVTIGTAAGAVITKWMKGQAQEVSAQTIAPVTQELSGMHDTLNSHEQTLRDHEQLIKDHTQLIKETNDNLQYIRGRIDEKWGKK